MNRLSYEAIPPDVNVQNMAENPTSESKVIGNPDELPSFKKVFWTKESFVVMLLGILVLIAAFQAYELTYLAKLKAVFAASGSASGAASISSSAAASLQDLPNMVGGC